MNTPADLLRELLALVRTKLYAGRPEKDWHKQKKMVQQALTYPARQLKTLGVSMTDKRYREVMTEIVATMVRHGNLREVTWMGRYLLTTVQKHWQHHGDTYYTEGKNARSWIGQVMGPLERRHARGAGAEDPTVPILAGVYDALQVAKRKPKGKAAAPALQPDLFAGAKGSASPGSIAKQRAKTPYSLSGMPKRPPLPDSGPADS